MAMLPVFLIGLFVGILLSYAWYLYKKDIPSDVKLKIQQAEIIRYKNDNDMLNELIEKLYKKIDTLEKEVNRKKIGG